MNQMEAAVLNGPGKVEVQGVPIPECGPDDVLLRIEAIGLCGSDFAMYACHWKFLRPFVIGHEGYGRIVADRFRMASARNDPAGRRRVYRATRRGARSHP